MYGKLFKSTFTGSLFGRGAVTFATWAYIVSHTHLDSSVEINPAVLAASIGCTVDEISAAIEYFCTPDPASRTKTEDGKRLIREGEYLYRVVNYSAYNGLKSDEGRREYMRLAKRRQRERESSHVKPECQQPSNLVSSTLDIDIDLTLEKKRKEKISVPSEPHSDKSEIERVFDHWKTIWEHPRASLDAKRTATIKKALKGYGADLLCQSISGYRHSPHHTGLNDRNTVYDDIGLLLRDSAHIDAGIRFATDPPNLSSKITRHNVSVLSDWTAPEDEHVADRPIQISGGNGEHRGGLRQGNIQAAREPILGRAEGSADRGSPSFGETLDKKR